jgi:tRNA dimethylallyltransferase
VSAPPDAPRLVVVVGPTGAGKTRLALDLAARVGGEVVSCDSQQVYLGMDIGTGKVGAADRARIPHHLLDVVRPDQEMTAARFVALADAAIRDVAGRGRPVIVCGGTGLYVRSLLLGLFDGPGADPAIRARLDAEAAAIGTAALHARLAAVDPAIAARVEVNDRKRIVRALEVFELTGEPMSVHQQRHDHRAAPPRYPARLIGLAPDRDALYRHIDARVDAMMAEGLLAEVETLRAAGYRPPLRSQQAIGYAELHDHLDGSHDLARALELIKRNSRRYARRQISWYRPDPTVTWADNPAAVDLGSLAGYLAGR